MSSSLENMYRKVGEADDFDVNSLSGTGSVIVELDPYFGERQGKDNSFVLDIRGTIARVASADDEDHVGKSWTVPTFVNLAQALSVKQLKTFLRQSGADIDSWGPETPFPWHIMIPGFFKLIASHQQHVLVKIRKADSAKYATLDRVIRAMPAGEGNEPVPFDNALPLPIPNELVRSAYDDETLETPKKSSKPADGVW